MSTVRSVPSTSEADYLARPESLDRIEVVRTYDRLAKRAVYATAGVRWYWLVEPRGPGEPLCSDGLSGSEACQAQLVRPLLPGLAIDLGQLFAD